MQYRVESESKWYKSLRGAKSRAIDVQRGRDVHINVVDEEGTIVWTTPKLKVIYRGETHVKPKQPDLF